MDGCYLREDVAKLTTRVEKLEKANKVKQRPVECPVCKGVCKVKKPPSEEGTYYMDKLIKCPACKGEGIVWGP